MSFPLDSSFDLPFSQDGVTDAVLGAEAGVDIAFSGGVLLTPKGDFATVSGDENLRRAIIRRLITRPGEYRLNPAYGVGLGNFVSKPATKALLDQLRLRIIDNLSRERRIDKLLQVTVESKFFGDSPGLQVTVVAQSKGRTVRFQPFNFTRGI